jgi:plastocyanin
MRKFIFVLPVAAAFIVIGAIGAGADTGTTRQVNVPEADRFTPFGLQVRVGDSVRWVNHDEDDHTVVSDDAFDTVGLKGTNRLLPVDGSVTLRFQHAGMFVYYCRFHAHLDAFNQPVAPGPDGGIEEAGNFGTPMSGVVTVLPR